MYSMNNDGKLFADEITNWLIDELGFNKYKYQMSVYYKYETYGSKLVVLSYVDDCVYWYCRCCCFQPPVRAVCLNH